MHELTSKTISTGELITRALNLPRGGVVGEPALVAMLQDLEAAHVPASLEQAKEQAEILVGSYPKHAVDDPQIYARGIVSLLCEYPRAISSKAIDRVTRVCKWVPTRAELYEALEKEMTELRRARFYVKTQISAAQHLVEYQAEQERLRIDRENFRLKHGDKSPLQVLAEMGKWSGLTSTEKAKPNEQTRRSESKDRIQHSDGFEQHEVDDRGGRKARSRQKRGA
jgi:hypothetical protein